MSCGDIFLGLLAIIFPPIAVWIKSGICSADSFINILLCLLGYIPGLIHAWYIIAVHPEYDDDYEPIGDAERGHSTQYYIVDSRSAQSHPGHGGGRQYGTATTNRSAPKPQQPPTMPSSTRPEGPGEAESSSGEARAPPTYDEALRGDNKIQTRD